MSTFGDLRHRFEQLPAAPRAGFWIVVAGGTFIIMMAIARHLGGAMHILEVVFWRAAFGVVFMVPWLVRQGPAALRTRKAPFHLGRTLLNYSGLICVFFAATMIPLADITAIGFTRPIVGSALAILILGEAARARRWAATMAGFAGALIVIRPGIVEVHPGVMLVIASVASGAFSAILARYLVRTDSPDATAMYMVLFLTPISLVPAAFFWRWPTAAEWPWLLVLGALGTLSQRSLVRAYEAAEATVVLSFDFLRLPLAALIGFILFAEVPGIWVWVGGAVICGASAYMARGEARAARGSAG
jgi:drug/metabolite transporter (DMT)-like permease